MWGVIALTVATFTVLLAARRLLMAGSQLAFSTDRDGGAYRVRFEVGGPGVFHNVTVQLFGVPESGEGAELEQPAVRHTMAAGDGPMVWSFRLPDTAAERAWVMVTWIRPYLQGVESEALAQWLLTGRLHEWRWYSETTRYVRTVSHFVARRWSAGESMRELPLYGRWRRTSSNTSADLLGPATTPPPTK